MKSLKLEIIEIKFIDLGEIDPLFFESSYYLGHAEVSIKAFELLRGVLERKKKAAITKNCGL